jgi:ankyrin repeat protein
MSVLYSSFDSNSDIAIANQNQTTMKPTKNIVVILQKKMSSPNERLVSGAQNADVRQMKRALESGADINALVNDATALTALCTLWPTKYEDEAFTFVLNQPGLRVDVPQGSGHTALHLSVLFQRSDLVQRLLDAGADVHLANRVGEFPLSIAAGVQFGMQLLPMLMARGAASDVNRTVIQEPGPYTHVGWHSLCVAANRGSDEMVQFLLAHGAELDRRCGDHGQDSPLSIAITAKLAMNQWTSEDVAVRLLRAGADYSRARHGDRSLLHLAVKATACKTVDWLLALGVSAAELDSEGQLPIEMRMENLERGRSLRGTLFAMGSPVPANTYIPPKDLQDEMDDARVRIARIRILALGDVARRVCGALRNLRLPQPVLLCIVEQCCSAFAADVPMHIKEAIVALIG